MPAIQEAGEPADPDPDPDPSAVRPPGDRLSSSGPAAGGAENTVTGAVLGAERSHLRRSREFLRLMRENVLSLEALGGDRVSEEYLKADLYRRAEALRDLPGIPLFFGRLDYAGPPPERFHIGRRHVHDQQGHPMVIDWRAPVSRPFYRASRADPMGVTLRRRFGFSGGELTAYEDEDLGGQGGPAQSGLSRIMIEEIERPRVGPMRDIVATIQPDQDDIVRADASQTVCVQGAPGTGKTAVGLHRVAYLLYAFPERMRRGGVLVIGPNRAFLGYIRDVLPALGEMDVTQVTVGELVGAAVPAQVRARMVKGDGKAERIKGDARMAEVLRRAIWSHVRPPVDAVVLPRGARRWRVPAYEVADLVSELRERGVRYGAGRELLAHRIAHVILTRMEAEGEPCDDRTHDAVRRSRPVKAAVDQAWPPVDPVRIVMRLLSDPGLLAQAADGLLSHGEQAAIRWTGPRPPRGPGSARWSAADAVLIDEAADLIERTPSLNHVVVDEAQDLSAMECRAIGRRCATGSATVLGDIAQGTTPWASRSWSAFLSHLGKPGAVMRVLDTGYRVPRQIIDYANRLLPLIAPGLAPAASVRQSPGSLEIVATGAEALGERVAALCRHALTEPGSVGVIGADDHVPTLTHWLTEAGVAHTVLNGAAQPGTRQPGPTYEYVTRELEGGRAARAAPQATPGAVPRAMPGVSPAAASGGASRAMPGVSPAAASGGAAPAARGASPGGAAQEDPAERLAIVPVTLAKGLEFDQVIVVEPARIIGTGASGLRRLYVALTRAVSRLCVLHAEPLPEPLSGQGARPARTLQG
jgi:DNA helicase IV